MIYEASDIVRTIDDHIDFFESIGVLLKERDGFEQADSIDLDRANRHRGLW